MEDGLPRGSGVWLRAGFYSAVICAAAFLVLTLAVTGDWPRLTQGRSLFIVPFGVLTFGIGLPGCFVALLFLFDGLREPDRAPDLISRSVSCGLAASALNLALSPLLIGALGLLRPRGLPAKALIVSLSALIGPLIVVGSVWIRSRRASSRAGKDSRA